MKDEVVAHWWLQSGWWLASLNVIDACRTASRKASIFMEGSISVDDEREALRLPGFENAVVTAVTKALEKWREEALSGTFAACSSQQYDHAFISFQPQQIFTHQEQPGRPNAWTGCQQKPIVR